jgi:hypothetical protein
LEIKRHIEVQVKLNFENNPREDVAKQDFIKAIHKAFYAECTPDELLVSSSDNAKFYEIEPGEYRATDVVVGQHRPQHQI